MQVPNFLGKTMRRRTERLASAFDTLANDRLQPISSLAVDDVRHCIDGAVASLLGVEIVDNDGDDDGDDDMRRMINVDENKRVVVRLDALRKALAAEPSIAGIASASEREAGGRGQTRS